MALYYPLPPQTELNVQALENALEPANITNSYKLYWFAALLEEINRGSTEVSFERMFALMVTKCWHTLVKFKLNLGAIDMLHNIVSYLATNYMEELPPDISQAELLEFLVKLNDDEYLKAVKMFTRYVPYRFLSTFYRKQLQGKDDHIKNKIIEDLSWEDRSSIYCINSSDSKIVINYKWFRYLYRNMSIIVGWHRYKLIEFLQRRNPNVPAIVDKIDPPQIRNLIDASKYWRQVASNMAIKDIYSGIGLSVDNMSLDHFIPWSFVLHDKLWNLIPVTPNTNSMKGDKLPRLDKYLDDFVDIHYKALMATLICGYRTKLLEDYMMLGIDINFEPRIDRNGFEEKIKNTIIPLHRIALNQGFYLWE